MTPLSQARANLPAAEKLVARLENVLQRHFHNDLFLMISGADKRMTATEVAERQGEKLLMLGPVLDRLRSELFQPLIERVYGIMDRAGMIAFPPEMLAGREINVEFISILANAQKQAGLQAISQTLGFAGQVAAVTQDPAAVDILNAEAMIRKWGELTGIDPDMLLSEDKVARKREARMQQMQMQQMLSVVRQGAEAADKGSRAMKNILPGGPQGPAAGPAAGQS